MGPNVAKWEILPTDICLFVRLRRLSLLFPDETWALVACINNISAFLFNQKCIDYKYLVGNASTTKKVISIAKCSAYIK